MVSASVIFRPGRLRLMFVAFLLGWLSTGVMNHLQNAWIRGKLTPLYIRSDEDDTALHLLTTKGLRYQDEENDPYTNTTLHRELFRRRAINTVNYMWSVAYANLSTIQMIVNTTDGSKQWRRQLKSIASSMKKFLKDSTLYILANLHKIESMDGSKIHRKERLNRLSSFVQTQISVMQNPPDCSRAKTLLADISWPCGYGCHVHYLMFCLNMAYATGRTLILQSLKPNRGKWWTESYLPFSDKCSAEHIKEDEIIIDMDHDNFDGETRVMRCTFHFYSHAQNVSVAPPAVPSDLAPLLLSLHAHPAVWFLGQLAQYVTRPKPKFRSQLEELASWRALSLKNNSPVVGVHVRRTDKVYYHEGELHNLSEYMFHVNRYFDYVDEIRALEDKNNLLKESKVQRQIYLASDDPTVFIDMKEQYPQYVVHNATAETFVAKAGGRYPTDERTRIAMEIFLLSFTDYIVCTLSSNVCRLAYELMQAQQNTLGDASGILQSIDTSYYWNNGQSVTCEMVKEEQEMNLHRGDVVDIWSGHLNSPFERKRLKNKTYFFNPPYKCVPRVIIADMKCCSKK